jgi:hypothetical protein
MLETVEPMAERSPEVTAPPMVIVAFKRLFAILFCDALQVVRKA